MILTVDIGNSRIKWALWQAQIIISRGVAAYAKDRPSDTFDKLFSMVASPKEQPSRVLAVCVAEDVMSQSLSSWVKQRWQLDVEYLKTEKQYGDITNAYPDPEQHGVDRWAGVVAGHLGFPGCSVCVVSAGTAITFDLINKNGQHLGGYILPSYATMHKALIADTTNVEAEFSMRFHKSSIPDNTNDAVNQGLHKFIQAGIRELCRFAESKMDEPMKIILTGGFAKTILAYPDMPAMHHKPDLVMEGLYNIMKQQKS